MSDAGATMRRDAVASALAAIRAVDPFQLTRRALETAALGRSISIIAIGKAAIPMTRAALGVLGARVVNGVVIAPVKASIDDRLDVYTGGHPIPSAEGQRGAARILELVSALGEADDVLCLVSGGASALSMLPAAAISLEDAQGATDLLLRSGATIAELNCVRKHIDQLKGGRLAAAAFPARVTALVLSDVIGDSLSTIASGPTVPDPTSVGDAIGVLRNRGVWDSVPESIREHLSRGDDESPKDGDARLVRTESRVIGSNCTAAEAARDFLVSCGYVARVVTTELAGEAREAGAEIVRTTRDECRAQGAPVALVFAGETTVTVRGAGKGGRNQELALAAAIAAHGEQSFALASIGTDGIDGPTSAAGAVIDNHTVAGSDAAAAAAALDANDSNRYFTAAGGLVITGPTGTNVMDIVVAIALPDAKA